MSETHEVRGASREIEPLIAGHQTSATLTDSLLRPVFERPGILWKSLVGLTSLGTLLFAFAFYTTLTRGIGMWGNNIPVGWAYGIVNFVWWIGFGHAGTLISAILVLFEQHWRASINRFAEAMTLFAVMQAGLFPLLHLGRPWYFFWLIPYPSVQEVWPQFRSPLPWDIAAILTYLTVSLLFWYLGLIPDFAAARDRAPTRTRAMVYAVASLGWRNSARHWHHYRTAYLLLAALATPLVISVHTIVSFDFAVSQLPGWHTTIFPPYFVAGAIFSGLALVLLLLLPARRLLRLEHVVTGRHVDVLGKLLLATSLMVAYGYLQENFFAWFGGSEYERALFEFKRSGPFGWLWKLQIFLNVVAPQLLWIRRLRTNVAVLWLVSIGAAMGMWIERFTIIVPPLMHDFLPASWGDYAPTWVDWSLLFGSMCFFGLLFLLFVRFVPPIPLSEVKQLNAELAPAGGAREVG